MIEPFTFRKNIAQVCTPLPGSVPAPTFYRLPVKQKYDGYNIIDFFLEIVPRSTPDIWTDKINKQSLFVNGKPAQLDTKLIAGQITTHQSEPKTEPFVSSDIDLIYSDNQIIVINKPAPLPMHPSGRFNRNSLTEILKLALPEEDFKIVHRLDANTTGIVILARDKQYVQSLGLQFEQKTTVKKYLALVEGIPTEREFTSDIKIGLEKTAGGGRASDENSGVDASTHFKVIKTYPIKNQTLLEVTPYTGRTNQIRLHLSELNLPIVGDIGYKDKDYFKSNPLTYSMDCLYLHAWKLQIKINGIPKEFTATVPEKYPEF